MLKNSSKNYKKLQKKFKPILYIEEIFTYLNLLYKQCI
ncbi:hypothetical protein BCD_0913 (plasmid) [Borrelia crocidurae DOU]|uniref:Uncharacterized protein n=1 Tax=Borrelia crocidurae DOU TaxID=1293575 RepID=W5SIJ9_9SPIR|nr:hypothetical protein BCD_0913 [Borrelia crocidurae DOU]